MELNNKIMNFISLVTKMSVENSSPIKYYLKDYQNDSNFELNKLIGSQISIEYLKSICIKCKKVIKNIYRQGHCYKCYWDSPISNQSIFKPELSKAHLGIEVKDLEWEKKFELQPHIAYIAYSDKVKIGITRKSNIPNRWIDQGAKRSIIIAEAPNRYTSGLIEVNLKDKFPDKTNWRKMLVQKDINIDLISYKRRTIELLSKELKKYYVEENISFEFNYPITQNIDKVKSVKINEDHILKGKLIGIKGQYLIFEDGNVINIRNQAGKLISISY